MCWETDFSSLFLVGRCCAVFLTAVHLAIARKGGLAWKVACSLLLFTWVPRIKLGGLRSFEGGKERKAIRLIHVIRAGDFTKAISCLGATGRGEIRRKKGAALLLSKGDSFGGGGQEFEIKYVEEKPVRGKISCKRCPFSLSDGFANKACLSPRAPRLNNSCSGTVLYSPQICVILAC